MNDDLLLQGLATRRKLSSQQDIDDAFEDPSPWVQLFEEFSTEQYWGACWSDETLSHRERSWLSLGMAAASGQHREFAVAVKTALNSGITESELRAAIRQIVLWCGLAIGAECVKAAREVIDNAERLPARSSKRKEKQASADTAIAALPLDISGTQIPRKTWQPA